MDPAVCIEMALKIEALYNWVGERYTIEQKRDPMPAETYSQGKIIGSMYSYVQVQLKMRTLFSGLIEFEQTEEKQKNGL